MSGCADRKPDWNARIKAKRNRAIKAQRLKGWTFVRIARKHRLTRSAIMYICKN